MLLFKWSTPERRRGSRNLPIIPNEIYFHIFEHIVPPSGGLTPEQLGIFTNLSLVCRFFANFCLPRMFEFVGLSGADFRNGMNTELDNLKTSRGTTLCTQIAAKQPLALALTKVVRECHFIDWNFDCTSSWAQLFVSKYLSSMSLMTNLRKLDFISAFVDARHWKAMAKLPSLEELSFTWVHFLQGPPSADVHPEKGVVKVPCLELYVCHGDLSLPFATVDAQHIRTLHIHCEYFEEVDWPSLSSLTELHFQSHYHPRNFTPDKYMEQLRAILTQVPQHLEVLGLVIDVTPEPTSDLVRDMFDEPGWNNLPLLHSLILQVHFVTYDLLSAVLSGLESVGLTHLQSLELSDSTYPPTSVADVLEIIRNQLGPTSYLKHIKVRQRVFHLVDGEWLEVTSRTT